MKTRIYLLLCAIALMAALIAGVTVAFFTHVAENPQETFTAGKLEFTLGGITFPNENFPLQPGYDLYGTFTITNSGTLDFKYRVTHNATGGIFDEVRPDSADVHGAYVDIWVAQSGEIKRGAYEVVHFRVSMPAIAEPIFQGASGQLEFTVQATQIANSNWVWPSTGGP